MIIRKKITWEMGHALSYPYEGKCNACHGHSWVVEFAYEGPIDDRGMVKDFADFGKMKEWIDRNMDHRFYVQHNHPIMEPYSEGDREYAREIEQLGLVPVDFNPTSENIARFLYLAASEEMSLDSAKLEVTVWETCTSSATFRGSDL